MDTLWELTDKYDIAELVSILKDYVAATGSEKAKKILEDPEKYASSFKKIVPDDYQRMLTAISKYEEQGISHENAVYEAFREVSA
jgi:glutamate synthase (ferredoxin)